jgi:hypothetical protein
VSDTTSIHTFPVPESRPCFYCSTPAPLMERKMTERREKRWLARWEKVEVARYACPTCGYSYWWFPQEQYTVHELTPCDPARVIDPEKLRQIRSLAMTFQEVVAVRERIYAEPPNVGLLSDEEKAHIESVVAAKGHCSFSGDWVTGRGGDLYISNYGSLNTLIGDKDIERFYRRALAVYAYAQSVPRYGWMVLTERTHPPH